MFIEYRTRYFNVVNKFMCVEYTIFGVYVSQCRKIRAKCSNPNKLGKNTPTWRSYTCSCVSAYEMPEVLLQCAESRNSVREVEEIILKKRIGFFFVFKKQSTGNSEGLLCHLYNIYLKTFNCCCFSFKSRSTKKMKKRPFTHFSFVCIGAACECTALSLSHSQTPRA